MSTTKQTLYGILKGKFLVDEDAQKNWGFIIFLTVLALLMIASSHSIDKKVQKIAQLNKKNRELRSQFVATRSDLMQLKMESSINKELEKRGFYSYLNPPKKIKVIIKE
jgi:Tfp pilus assembly protein PilO